MLEGKWIYCPQISKSMPDLHFLHAEKTCNRVMAYTKSPVNKTVYQEKNGKIIPYVPALKKVSKTALLKLLSLLPSARTSLLLVKKSKNIENLFTNLLIKLIVLI